MSKTRVTWSSGQDITATRLNEMVVDRLRNGQLVYSKYVYMSAGIAGNGHPTTPDVPPSTIYLVMIPYLSEFRTWDYVRLETHYSTANGVAGYLEFSIDNGATWTEIDGAGGNPWYSTGNQMSSLTGPSTTSRLEIALAPGPDPRGIGLRFHRVVGSLWSYSPVGNHSALYINTLMYLYRDGDNYDPIYGVPNG
jgi:hypothetical protein